MVPPVRCTRIADLVVEVLEPALRDSVGPTYTLRDSLGLVSGVRAALSEAYAEFGPGGQFMLSLGSIGPASPAATLRGQWSVTGSDDLISVQAGCLDGPGYWRTWDAEIDGQRIEALLVDPATATVAHVHGRLVDTARAETALDPPVPACSGLPRAAPQCAIDVDQPIFDVELDAPDRRAVLLINGYHDDDQVSVHLTGRSPDAGGPGLLDFPQRARASIVRGAAVAIAARASEFEVPPVWWHDGRRVEVERARLEIGFNPSEHSVRGAVHAALRGDTQVQYGFSGVLRSRNVQRVREWWRHPRPAGRWLPVLGLGAPVSVSDRAAAANGEPRRITLPGRGWLRHVPCLDVLVGLGGRGKVLVARREVPVVIDVPNLGPGDRAALRQLAQDMCIAGRPVEARPLLDRATALYDAVLADAEARTPGSGDSERVDVLLMLNLRIRCATQTRDYPALVDDLRRAVRERVATSAPTSAQVQLAPARDTVRSTTDRVRVVQQFAHALHAAAEGSPAGRGLVSGIPTAQLDDAVGLLDGTGQAIGALIDLPEPTDDELHARFNLIATAMTALRARLVELATAVLEHPVAAGLGTPAERSERAWVVDAAAVTVRSTDVALEDELMRRDAALEQAVRTGAMDAGAAEVFLLQKDAAATLRGAATVVGAVSTAWAQRSPVAMLTERRAGNTEAGLRFTGYLEQWRRRLDEDWERIAAVEEAGGFYEDLVVMLLDLGAVEEAWVAAELGRARATADLLQHRPGPALDVAALHRAVDELGRTVVEYFLTDEEIVVWVVAPGRPVRCVRRDSRRAELDADVARLHKIAGYRAPTPQDRAEFTRLLRRLAEMVWDPVPPDFLPDHPDAIITVVPTGPLNRIPFPALTGADGRALMTRHTLSVLPAVAILPDLLGRERTTRFGGPVLALVNPQPMPSEHYAPLTYTEQQWPLLAQLWTDEPVELGCREDATLDRLRSPERPPALLVLATHAEAEHVNGTFLALARTEHHDGRVRPSDLAELALPGSVVLLSACHTGGGRITHDGVEGLSRGFLVGGASVVVLTLFEVVEPIAMDFLHRLLRIWQEGLPIEAAARAAQLALAEEESDDPALWSPFLVHGVGGPLVGPEERS